MERESCGICGGDGRVSNAFGGSSTSCPSCHGTGRRSTSDTLFHDVTKTKPSHHHPGGKAPVPAKATWPSTFEGMQLANEVKASGLSDEVKARLVREIIEYEGSHGRCTQTFTKKIRKQVRPPSA
jgi:hypothetical protein